MSHFAMPAQRTPPPVSARFALLLGCALALPAVAAVPARAAEPAASGPAPAAQVQGADGWQRALLDRYCVACHNDRLRTADLALDAHDVTRIAAAPAVWETVVRKLRAGAMPPLPRPRPDAATYERFIDWLETELDRAAAADPNPGRTEAFHRLNRTEYQHAVRDLLDLEIDVAELLPGDGASYGFDNIAGVLGVSPTLLETLPRRRAQDQPRRDRTSGAFGHRRGLSPGERPAAGRLGGGDAVRHPRRRRFSPRVPGGRRLPLPHSPGPRRRRQPGRLRGAAHGGGKPGRCAGSDLHARRSAARGRFARQRRVPRLAGWATHHRPRLGVPPAGEGRAARVERDLRAADCRLSGDAAPAVSAAVHEHHRR